MKSDETKMPSKYESPIEDIILTSNGRTAIKKIIIGITTSDMPDGINLERYKLGIRKTGSTVDTPEEYFWLDSLYKTIDELKNIYKWLTKGPDPIFKWFSSQMQFDQTDLNDITDKYCMLQAQVIDLACKSYDGDLKKDVRKLALDQTTTEELDEIDEICNGVTKDKN